MSDSVLFEENNNNNEFQPKISFSKNDILSLIEKSQLERDRAISNYSSLKIDYNTLQKDYNSLQTKINSMEIDLKNATSKSSFSELKLKENLNKLFSTEKKLTEVTGQKDVLSRTNQILENQISKYKDVYTDLKSRTNKEISFLKSSLEEAQREKEDLMKENTNIKRELNKNIFKNKLLEKENETIKSDNDNLMKIIQEHNDIVKTSESKLISFDNTIKEYKNQINNLNLEIDKLQKENKLQKEYSDKYKSYFEDKIIMADNNFEKALDNIRKNFRKKIDIKMNEFNSLKSEYMNTKIERDKFFTDFTMLKDELNQNNERFQQQYLDLKEEKQKKEIELNREIGHLTEKVNILLEENLKLKNKNNDLKNKIDELKAEDDIREKLEKKNQEINSEVNRINKKNEDLIQENEMLTNKINELLNNDEN